MKELTVSIVSHGQGELVSKLLEDIRGLNFFSEFNTKIVVTINIPEDESFLQPYLTEVSVIRNVRPLGFGANHNQAFSVANSDFFLVLNPDLRIDSSFSLIRLSRHLSNKVGCVSPRVLSVLGEVEDNARRYPSVMRILKRNILQVRGLDYLLEQEEVEVEWLAGMFLLFRSDTFSNVSGFDHRFFMYLEDADICRRVNRASEKIVLITSQKVVHDARRNSFKSVHHAKWHTRSMFRFLFGV